ncbi:MAG: hypothetical protein ACRDNY_09480 [Gaiellaceae bacterium]
MTVFTKRNALVGFLTLKALERRRRRNRLRTNAPKIGLFLVLGLLSLGILAGLGAVLLKHHRGEGQHLEGYAADESESEIVGEYVTASSEPIPAA